MTLTPRHFIGVDIEATGPNIGAGHRMIQIGLAILPVKGAPVVAETSPVMYSALIQLPSDAPWDPKAARVHNIPRSSLVNADPIEKVEQEATAFLDMFLGDIVEDRSLIAVGFNTAGFDMRFIRQQAPGIANLFSYRTVDLNAPIFTLSLASGRGFMGMKRAAKRWAWETMGPEAKPHDAGSDAIMHLYVFKYLQDHATEFSMSAKAWKTYQRTQKST